MAADRSPVTWGEAMPSRPNLARRLARLVIDPPPLQSDASSPPTLSIDELEASQPTVVTAVASCQPRTATAVDVRHQHPSRGA